MSHLRSVLNFVTDAHVDMREIVGRSESLMKAVGLLDRVVGAASAQPLVGGKFIEVDVLALMDAAESHQVARHDVQFVLNTLSKDLYTFGGRGHDGAALSSGETLSFLRRALSGLIGAQEAPATPVHRFLAAELAQ